MKNILLKIKEIVKKYRVKQKILSSPNYGIGFILFSIIFSLLIFVFSGFNINKNIFLFFFLIVFLASFLWFVEVLFKQFNFGKSIISAFFNCIIIFFVVFVIDLSLNQKINAALPYYSFSKPKENIYEKSYSNVSNINTEFILDSTQVRILNNPSPLQKINIKGKYNFVDEKPLVDFENNNLKFVSNPFQLNPNRIFSTTKPNYELYFDNNISIDENFYISALNSEIDTDLMLNNIKNAEIILSRSDSNINLQIEKEITNLIYTVDDSQVDSEINNLKDSKFTIQNSKFKQSIKTSNELSEINMIINLKDSDYILDFDSEFGLKLEFINNKEIIIKNKKIIEKNGLFTSENYENASKKINVFLNLNFDSSLIVN